MITVEKFGTESFASIAIVETSFVLMLLIFVCFVKTLGKYNHYEFQAHRSTMIRIQVIFTLYHFDQTVVLLYYISETMTNLVQSLNKVGIFSLLLFHTIIFVKKSQDPFEGIS